jgi:hypothetical protein
MRANRRNLIIACVITVVAQGDNLAHFLDKMQHHASNRLYQLRGAFGRQFRELLQAEQVSFLDEFSDLVVGNTESATLDTTALDVIIRLPIVVINMDVSQQQ